MAKAKSVKVAPAAANKRVVKKAPGGLEKETQELIINNLHGMTLALAGLASTGDTHVQKTASIAIHVIAIEELLSEIISKAGVDLVKVNNRIRARIAIASIEPDAADIAIDCAASIAAPSPST